MKKTIIVGIAALALGSASMGTANATPGSFDHNALAYLQMLNNDGITVLNAARAIEFAHWTCGEMAVGYDAHQVRDIAWNMYGPANGMTYQNWLDQVEDAAINFCPHTWDAVLGQTDSA